MSNNQTLGQRRVKAEFNPSKKESVDLIKNLSAQLIDEIEILKTSHPTNAEKNRLIAIAQTHIETACMYAVKANFTKT